MANLTDPLIRAVQGSDPQNLMEYITRQKIYDSRFWKEECFGLTAADVLEKAAKSLTCIGGTMGANQQPTKFLCLTLKLLQLQPDLKEVIQDEFIHQNHFKYVRALGAFYLRLTGRPADIYQTLEPLYCDYSKLKVRERNEWKLTYMDQVVQELLTEGYFVGITLPRLPARETLQQEAYLEEGPRNTALEEAILKAGGLEEYLQHKAHVEKSPAAIELWNERTGKSVIPTTSKNKEEKEGHHDDDASEPAGVSGVVRRIEETSQEEPYSSSTIISIKRKETTRNHHDEDEDKDKDEEQGPQKKKQRKSSKKEKGYGSLFKKDKNNKQGEKERQSTSSSSSSSKNKNNTKAPEEGSEEYWNQERAKLGLKPLNSK